MAVRRWAFLVCSLLVLSVAGQPTGMLYGVVKEVMSATPLVGATVQVFTGDGATAVATDAEGGFRFEVLSTGIHRVRVSYVGYRAVELPEVWVRSGHAEHVMVELSRAVNELGEVEVRAHAPDRMDAIAPQLLTVEQSLRYPASFFDPARLAMSYTGVAGTNDQANHFSVRGNNPSNNAWLLEGVEIVTPNHLTNAGTQSDLPTLTGGGTTIVSAQMLGTSRLLTGPLAAPYGNALGGIMDLRLRRGITQRRAHTVQAGLIGIDLSTEGPFKKGGRASYLINYRYSTLGLLGAMGVALGDEAITFHDLAFTVHLPLGTRTEVLLFGMGGSSSNRFEAKDSTAWEFDKDSQDIDYEAQVGAVGLSIQQRIGQRARWNTTVAWSRNQQERRTHTVPYRRFPSMRDTARLAETKLSARTRLLLSVGTRGRLEVGVQAMERTVEKELIQLEETTAGWMLRPYVRYEHDLTDRLQLDVGVARMQWTYNGSGVTEPRAALAWAPGERSGIRLGVGIRGQLPPLQNYALHYGWRAIYPIRPTENDGLLPITGRDAELAYEHRSRPHLMFTVAAFAQQQRHVPVGVARAGLTNGARYSAVNEWDRLTVLPLASNGEALMTGGRVAFEHTLFHDLFYQVNATLYDATYTDGERATYDSRWNTGYVANAIVGREFVRQKEEGKRTWGVNGRINATGGQRYTPTGSLPLPAPYSAQYKGSYRVDLRIYLRRERKGHTSIWALDLLNATNVKNEAYRYFDLRKGEEVTQYQLGLVPNVSYRVEF